jgi:Ion channel
LLGVIVVLRLVVGFLEGWSVQESIYFAFVSGLTISYGDLAPRTLLTRTLAILIGVCGMLVTALVEGAGRSVCQRAVPERAQLHRFQTFYMAPLTTANPALQRSGA